MTIKSLQHSSLTDNIFYRSMLAGNAPSGLAAYRFQLIGSTQNELAYAIDTDSDDNVIFSGWSDSVNGEHAYTAKFDSEGAVLWEKLLEGSAVEDAYGQAVDSNGGIFVVGKSSSLDVPQYRILYYKYNAAGVLQWQKYFNGTSGNPEPTGAAVDSSDNFYGVGQLAESSKDAFIWKVNNGGTLQWQRYLTADTDQFQAVAVDSSDNAIGVGQTNYYNGAQWSAFIAKYNSAGTLQWQRILRDSSPTNTIGHAVTTDSSDNIYIAGEANNDGIVAKYNSAGTLQWQRIIGGAGYEQMRGIRVSAAGDVYAVGRSSTTSPTGSLIVKYNSAGTLQWQRKFSGTSTDIPNYLSFDSNENLYITGQSSSGGQGSYDFPVLLVPNDGSLEGTYVIGGDTFVYAASSLTSSTSTLLETTSSLTSVSSSFGQPTPSLTANSVSFTIETVLL